LISKGTVERGQVGQEGFIFHFPFSISHLSLAPSIVIRHFCGPFNDKSIPMMISMTNEKWKMENGKWKMNPS